MGNRAFSDLIRSGEDEAVVEALFDTLPCRKVKTTADGGRI
ncbi:MAG: hypothetical protein U5R30_14835 [Deltaproteobacteria bacterium]|nr:hypothetical protein [Deltaproteobacteria bacterium]